MCTPEQIERACGLLLLNEFDVFIYCCKKCLAEFECGSDLEAHILLNHPEDRKHFEHIFVNDGLLLDECDNRQQQPNCNMLSDEPLSPPEIEEVMIKIESDLVPDAQTEEQIQQNNDGDEVCSSPMANGNIERNFHGNIARNNEMPKASEQSLTQCQSESVNRNNTDDSLKATNKQHQSMESSLNSNKKQMVLFYCEMCPDVTFTWKMSLRKHMDRHIANKLPKYCAICNRRTKNYDRHMTMHAEGNPYKCDFCEKLFRNNQNRENHIRIHTKQRPFLCSMCGKTFATLTTKNRHEIQMHAKKRPHECQHCNRTFLTPSHLEEHFYSFHSDERRYVCEMCGKNYSTKKYLRRHKEIHGDKTHKCIYCAKKFKTTDNRRAHERTIHDLV